MFGRIECKFESRSHGATGRFNYVSSSESSCAVPRTLPPGEYAVSLASSTAELIEQGTIPRNITVLPALQTSGVLPGIVPAEGGHALNVTVSGVSTEFEGGLACVFGGGGVTDGFVVAPGTVECMTPPFSSSDEVFYQGSVRVVYESASHFAAMMAASRDADSSDAATFWLDARRSSAQQMVSPSSSVAPGGSVVSIKLASSAVPPAALLSGTAVVPTCFLRLHDVPCGPFAFNGDFSVDVSGGGRITCKVDGTEAIRKQCLSLQSSTFAGALDASVSVSFGGMQSWLGPENDL